MLICDKRRPARARGYQYQAPPRGPNKDSPPGLRPAPRALLRVGRHAPRPPGLRPLARLRAPGPCCLGHPAGRLRGTGAPGGQGGQRAALSTLDAQPLLPLNSVFQKQGNRSVGKPQACPPEGVSPCSGGGGQTPAPPAGRLSTLGGQRGCPRPKRATGQSASATRHPVPARRRRSALCRFIRENDSCEFGKNPALARARARLLVFFS